MDDAAHLGSHFADADAARQAIGMAMPMIEAALTDKEVSGMGFLHVVVLDPALLPGRATFEQSILAEHAFGRERWDADYAHYARAKARLAWETGMDGHRLQTVAAHRLRRGESLLWGAVVLDGIVVGVSGAHPWYDEAFATAIAANLRAIAKARHAKALAEGKAAAGG